jgi:hypothetical protein
MSSYLRGKSVVRFLDRIVATHIERKPVLSIHAHTHAYLLQRVKAGY